MEIGEIAKLASNRTRNANQWLAEGNPDKAKGELNDLGHMLADNYETLQIKGETDPEKPDAAAGATTENKEDEERPTEADAKPQASEMQEAAKGAATDQSQKVSE